MSLVSASAHAAPSDFTVMARTSHALRRVATRLLHNTCSLPSRVVSGITGALGRGGCTSKTPCSRWHRPESVRCMSGAVESLWAGDATIAALSSAPGKAAVSVVRISGAATAEVLARCTTPWSRRSTSLASPRHAVGAKPGAHCTTSPNGDDVFGSTKVPISPRRYVQTACIARGLPLLCTHVGNRATRKYIVHPETGDLIDDALVLYFPGPHRYAGLTRFLVQCVGALTAFLAPAASLAKTWPNSTCTEVERSFPQRWTPCSLFL